MGDWTAILGELLESAAANGGKPNFDGVRRKYLAMASAHTKRSTILYAAKFTQPSPVPLGQFIAIADQDLQGIMNVVHELPGPDLDLILHSPGGSPHAAESMVSYLRSKYRHVRVVVPHLAMSAAAMIACAADTIVMGKHSFLGPIDPQIVVSTRTGQQMIPAQAILEQFDQAKKECQDPGKVGAWMPLLGQYGPGLLVQCRHASDLAEQLVTGWLERYMFKRRKDRKQAAARVGKWLSVHENWKSHGRQIPRRDLEEAGLRVTRLEKDAVAQDLLLSVFHATTHTFSGTSAVKIIENNLGKAFVQQVQVGVVEQSRSPRQAGLPPNDGATGSGICA